jgi:hypothetical protein
VSYTIEQYRISGAGLAVIVSNSFALPSLLLKRGGERDASPPSANRVVVNAQAKPSGIQNTASQAHLPQLPATTFAAIPALSPNWALYSSSASLDASPATVLHCFLLVRSF